MVAPQSRSQGTPECLLVFSPNCQQVVNGVYSIVRDCFANDLPIWQKFVEGSKMYIYSGLDRRWYVGTDMHASRGFQTSAGLIRSAPHSGSMPNTIFGMWDWWDSNVWHTDPDLMVTIICDEGAARAQQMPSSAPAGNEQHGAEQKSSDAAEVARVAGAGDASAATSELVPPPPKAKESLFTQTAAFSPSPTWQQAPPLRSVQNLPLQEVQEKPTARSANAFTETRPWRKPPAAREAQEEAAIDAVAAAAWPFDGKSFEEVDVTGQDLPPGFVLVNDGIVVDGVLESQSKESSHEAQPASRPVPGQSGSTPPVKRPPPMRSLPLVKAPPPAKVQSPPVKGPPLVKEPPPTKEALVPSFAKACSGVTQRPSAAEPFPEQEEHWSDEVDASRVRDEEELDAYGPAGSVHRLADLFPRPTRTS